MTQPIKTTKANGSRGAMIANSAARIAPTMATAPTSRISGSRAAAMTAPTTPKTSRRTRRIGKKMSQKTILRKKPTTASTAKPNSTAAAMDARTKRVNILRVFTRGRLLKFRSVQLVGWTTGRRRRKVLHCRAEAFVEAADCQRFAASFS
jgi:hypothetical protein